MLIMIAKCSRQTDTALKLISRSKEGSPLDIKQLLIRLIAQIKYLQNACLTGKMRVWSAQCTITPAIAEKQFWFHNQSISNVRIAAELASIPQSSSQSPNPSRFRGGLNRRYRGNYRSFGSFRGNNRDIFHSLKGQLRFWTFLTTGLQMMIKGFVLCDMLYQIILIMGSLSMLLNISLNGYIKVWNFLFRKTFSNQRFFACEKLTIYFDKVRLKSVRLNPGMFHL